MIQKKKGSLEWLEFELLQAFPEVVHGVFLKPLDFLAPEASELAKEHFGLEWLVSKSQVHSARVEPSDSLQIECDGILTDRVGEGLLIRHADCQAALFYDPVKKVVGNIHCGWRGSVQNIYKEAVTKLRSLFGSKPTDLHVCISPSLGPDNAEFKHFEMELPKSFHKYQVRPTYFDFWQLAKDQLMEEGIPEKQIEVASICTFAGKEDFFSHRRDTKRGRHGTVIALKEFPLYQKENSPE